MKSFLPAVLLFLLIVSVAPAIGHVRDFVFETFPRDGVKLLGAGFAVVAAGLLVYAVARIKTWRLRRYGGLLAVLALLWFQTVGLGTGDAKVNVVEKVHILEYGLLAFLIYRALLARADGAASPALLGLTFVGVALAGTFEEGVQYLVPQRTGDVRDVILNMTAGVSGLLFALCLAPPRSWHWRLDSRERRRLLRGLAFVILGLGLFFYRAHLGYEVRDPEIGAFRSRFTADELRDLAAKRTVEWAKDPPTALETWALEDYFLTEAAWHAQHRNGAQKFSQWTQQWLANRILEKYYDPFLDLESFRNSARHRYGAGERRALEEKKGAHDPSTYMSPVAEHRLFTWSKPWYVAGLAALVLLLWFWPRFLNMTGLHGRMAT